MHIIEKTYQTSEVAAIIGIHSNTVRMYEEWGLISKTRRAENGYRVFTDLHIDQLKLARTAFQIEVLQGDLRKTIISAVKQSALLHFDDALRLVNQYTASLQKEIEHAYEAVAIANDLLQGDVSAGTMSFKRKEVSQFLEVSMDTLRNWEMNGLLSVKRKKNGYRVYHEDDIKKLKIIRSLRCANYSLSAILRMVNALSKNQDINLLHVLNTPNEDEDIIAVCDKLIVSLHGAKENADQMILMLMEMKNKYLNPPL